MGRLRLHTAPATAVMTAAQARAFLHVDHLSEDGELDEMIEAATGAIETWTRRSLINTTWEYTIDAREVGRVGDSPFERHLYSGAAIKLPRAPLASIERVAYFTEADIEVEYPTLYYRADISGSGPGSLVFSSSAMFPATRARSALTVRFVAGYGPDAADVPAQLRQAVRRMVAYLYENRGDVPDSPPDSVAALLTGYRRVRV